MLEIALGSVIRFFHILNWLGDMAIIITTFSS